MGAITFLLPLYLAKEVKTIEGRTRLQKLVFLIQERVVKDLKLEEAYEFEPGTYGPYSRKLTESIKFMQSMRWVQEKMKTGEDKTLFVYELTQAGDMLVEQNKICNKIEETIKEIVKEYNKMELSELVERVHKEFPQFVKK